MKADFWHKLWDDNTIGFHKNHVNELFLQNFPKLELTNNSRIFIPLCGKTVDTKWLLDDGYKVVACELNENAIKELFAFLKLEPTITIVHELILYSAKDIDIFVGDIFKLDASMLGIVDAVYDRGAIVALPSKMRKDYTSLLLDITKNAPQLVITFDYDQCQMQGPPFSVPESNIKACYQDYYDLKILQTIQPKEFDKLKMAEIVWQLSPKKTKNS